MTQHEINSLIRPYLKRQQAKKEKEMYPFILAALVFSLVAAAFALTLSFALNH